MPRYHGSPKSTRATRLESGVVQLYPSAHQSPPNMEESTIGTAQDCNLSRLAPYSPESLDSSPPQATQEVDIRLFSIWLIWLPPLRVFFANPQNVHTLPADAEPVNIVQDLLPGLYILDTAGHTKTNQQTPPTTTTPTMIHSESTLLHHWQYTVLASSFPCNSLC